MSDPALLCCELARTCSEIVWARGRHMKPPQAHAGWTIVVGVLLVPPLSLDIERAPIAFCPFCGTKIEAP